MSRRYQIVLPDPHARRLHELALDAGEPPSTVAGQMVRSGLAHAASPEKPRQRPPLRALPSAAAQQRPAWFEPYGGDPSWRKQMWGSIVALQARYPRQLSALKDGWWRDEADTEVLCALAIWRGEIDDAGENPREELLFHRELADYALTLREQGGGIAATWQPGAPPSEWLSGG